MKMRIIETVEKATPARPALRLVPPHSTAPGALTTLDALNPARRYLATLSSASRRSMRANLQRVARLLKVPFEGVPWHMLRAPHIEALRAAMQDGRLSPATVNATLAGLKGVARQAFALHAISSDDYQLICEVRGVRGSRAPAGRALDVREVAALLDACGRDNSPAGSRDACLLALLAGAGLRRAEAVSLDLSDWRARAHALRVRGKGDKERIVYFEDGGARRALLNWLKVRGEEPGPLLLPVDRAGRVERHRLTGQAVYKALRKRGREAGIRRRFSPHSLRRFFASHLLEQGAGIGEVSELLGHASIETTAIYDRRGERAKQKAARLIRLPYSSGGGRRRRRRKRRTRK